MKLVHLVGFIIKKSGRYLGDALF